MKLPKYPNHNTPSSLLNRTTALGSLAVALATYILFQFIMPMAQKGLLWQD